MKKILIFSLVVAMLVACGKGKGSSRKADISGSNIEVKIQRFDKDFWSVKSNPNLRESLEELYAKYPTFAPIYFSGVVYFGNHIDTVSRILPLFYADSVAGGLYQDVLTKYADLSAEERQLTDAFKRGKYFFPQLLVPEVITCVSLLNQNIIIADSLIAIGLDKYMGKEYPLYSRNPNFYKYVLENWRSEKIVPDVVYVWLMEEIPYQTQSEQLLDELIYKGKLLYLTQLMLPDLAPELIIGYTSEQWKWCKEQEQAMWKTLVAEQHLFSTDPMLKLKYLQEAPFTQPFTQESPGRAGQFVGWQIVDTYMSRNQDVTPEELMQNLDAQKILEESGYNP